MQMAVNCVITALCTAVLFISYYNYCKDFCLNNLSDLGAHLKFARNYDLTSGEGFLRSWARVPHLMWHMLVRFFMLFKIPGEYAASYVYALLGVFAFIVCLIFVYSVIKYNTGRKEVGLSSVCSLVLSFVGPYAMPWFTVMGIYHGQYSPNPFHNPTHMAVKGFGLLLTMIGIDIFRNMKNEKLIFFKSNKYLVLKFGIILFFSVLAKPTFMYMLLPAGFLFMISELIIDLFSKKYPLNNILKVLIDIVIAVIPSALLVIAESIVSAKYADVYSTVILSFSKPLEVWHLYSMNVPTSILLAMFFPIVMCVTNPGFFLKSTEGRLSVFAYATGVLEFSLLKDAGYQMASANFAWCMMAGMVVLYTVSAAKLMVDSLKEDSTWPHLIYVISSWFFFFLHFYYGITFLLERPV